MCKSSGEKASVVLLKIAAGSWGLIRAPEWKTWKKAEIGEGKQRNLKETNG